MWESSANTLTLKQIIEKLSSLGVKTACYRWLGRKTVPLRDTSHCLFCHSCLPKACCSPFPAVPSPAGLKESDVHKQKECHGSFSAHWAGFPTQDSTGYNDWLHYSPSCCGLSSGIHSLVLSHPDPWQIWLPHSLQNVHTHYQGTIVPYRSSLRNRLLFLLPSFFLLSFLAKSQLPNLLYFPVHSSNHSRSIKSLYPASLSSHPRVCSWLLSLLCSTLLKLSLTFCLGLFSQLWTFPDNPVCRSNCPFTIYPVPSFYVLVLRSFPPYSSLDHQCL